MGQDTSQSRRHSPGPPGCRALATVHTATSGVGRELGGTSGNCSWLHLRLTFFILPLVTVERALDISRGLRPRKSPIFPSTCTMYLAIRKQRWPHQIWGQTNSLHITLTPRPNVSYSSVTEGTAFYPKLQKQLGPNSKVFSSPFLWVKPSECVFNQQSHIF